MNENSIFIAGVALIIITCIVKSTVQYVLDEILEQRRRETKTGEFEE